MASRQEEKERRRQARLEAEREAKAKEERAKRLRLVGGAALVVVVLAIVGIAVASSGGGSGKGSGPKNRAKVAASLPTPAIKDLGAAAKAAGCTVKSYPKHYEDRGHVPNTTKVHYLTNPPAFGKHFEIPARDGDYVGQGTPPVSNLVHSLEHGRIQYQYRPGLSKAWTDKLEALYNEDPDLVQVFQNNSGMRPQVAVVAWTHIAACPAMNAKVFDVFRDFRDKYRLKAPEVIPQAE
jgi:hypothetical protein